MPVDGEKGQKRPSSTILTTLQIVCWLDFMNGVPISHTAERLGLDRKTVSKYQKEVAEFVGSDIDVNNFRLNLGKLRPLAMQSLIKNLTAGKEKTTIAYFQGLGDFIAKSENDHNFAGMPDSELDSIIKDGYELTDKKDGRDGGEGEDS